MNAWISSKDKMMDHKCVDLFQEMKQEYKKGNFLLKPDSFIYCQVINALALAGKPLKAQLILSEMEENWIMKDTDPDAPAPTIEWYVFSCHTFRALGNHPCGFIRTLFFYVKVIMGY
jgi:hypothetical protein